MKKYAKCKAVIFEKKHLKFALYVLLSQTNILLLHVSSIIFEFESLIVAAKFHNVCSILQLELVIWLVIFHFMLVTLFHIILVILLSFACLHTYTISVLRYCIYLRAHHGASWRIHWAHRKRSTFWSCPLWHWPQKQTGLVQRRCRARQTARGSASGQRGWAVNNNNNNNNNSLIWDFLTPYWFFWPEKQTFLLSLSLCSPALSLGRLMETRPLFSAWGKARGKGRQGACKICKAAVAFKGCMFGTYNIRQYNAI